MEKTFSGKFSQIQTGIKELAKIQQWKSGTLKTKLGGSIADSCTTCLTIPVV
jgi:hypothetical protein